MSKTKTKEKKKLRKDPESPVVSVEWLNVQEEIVKILVREREKAEMYHLFRGEYYIDRELKPVLKKDVLKSVTTTKNENKG